MARTWKCKDCPQTGIQKTGRLRVRCDACKIVFKRENAQRHYVRKSVHERREKRRATSPQGFIYLLHALGTNTYKIGWTAKEAGIQDRIVRCQTGNAHKIVLLASIAGSRMDEADLHNELAKCRMEGEWFFLSPTLRQVARREFDCSLKPMKIAA